MSRTKILLKFPPSWKSSRPPLPSPMVRIIYFILLALPHLSKDWKKRLDNFGMFLVLTLSVFIAALKHGLSLLVVGADVYTVCQTVDALIESEIQKTFNSKKTKNLERGIAFPCCVSVNNVVGHFSPLADESVQLKEGDVAKLICGSHIDGYAATAAHTAVVGDAKVTGRKADVVLAAHHALKAAQRVIKDGGSNTEVTEAMNKIAAEYEVNIVEGVLSHTIKKFCIDGNKCIISKETPTQNVEEWIFAPGDVIGLDIYVSSGEGKPKQAESRTTVYKREL